MSKWVAFDQYDQRGDICDAEEAALAAAKKLVEGYYRSDDLFPDSVCHGDIVVAEVKYVSRYRVTERKEEYEARDEEWPYNSDLDTAGEIDIVQVEGQ